MPCSTISQLIKKTTTRNPPAKTNTATVATSSTRNKNPQQLKNLINNPQQVAVSVSNKSVAYIKSPPAGNMSYVVLLYFSYFLVHLEVDLFKLTETHVKQTIPFAF